MKKILILFSLVFLISDYASSQLVQSNFSSVLIPKYMCSGSSTRLPYIFRATVSGLQPNSTYRYYCQGGLYTDIGTTNSGAGNPVLINTAGASFRYSSSTSLANSSSYDSLTTDATGSYTGWFGFVNTGNARFTAGNYIIPTITLDSVGNGTSKYKYALSDSIFVLAFGTTNTSTNATGIYGISGANPKNIITLYDNVNNTGKPLSIAYVEDAGISASSISSLAQYYADSVIARNGRWGTIIPNDLSSGVRRVNVLSFSSAAVLKYSIDADGIWPSGANTVNPTGSSASPIRMTSEDIILSVGNINPVAKEFSLKQNYPNPFNPSTTIRFSIPAEGKVTLKVYDIPGKEITTLVNGNFSSGEYSVTFNATNMTSGVYFYSMEYKDNNGRYYKDIKKLAFIK